MAAGSAGQQMAWVCVQVAAGMDSREEQVRERRPCPLPLRTRRRLGFLTNSLLSATVMSGIRKVVPSGSVFIASH